MNQNDSARSKWIKRFAQGNNDNSNNQQYPKGFEKLQPRVI